MIDIKVTYRNPKMWDERMLRSSKFVAGALKIASADVIHRVKTTGMSAVGRPFTPYKSRPAKRLTGEKEVLEFLKTTKNWAWVGEVVEMNVAGEPSLFGKSKGGTKIQKLPEFWQQLYWVPTHMKQPGGWIKESKKTGAKGYVSKGAYLRAIGRTKMKNFVETGGMWNSVKARMITPAHGRLYFSGSSKSRSGRRVRNRIKARSASIYEGLDILAVNDREYKKVQLYINLYFSAYVFQDMKEQSARLALARINKKLTAAKKKMGRTVASTWAAVGTQGAMVRAPGSSSFTMEVVK